ncbi:MAG: TlyA family RNA methyltransferase [Myxococcota bacterium]|nr:TlyA family RNA methyltransferase [Myxococcota bacterium]
MAKQRADLLVVEQGLAETRSRAQALLLAGSIVAVDAKSGGERRVDKPGELLTDGTMLRLKGEPLRYVSRGGLKLEAALDRFHVDPAGKICMDVGASTGGFTDCLLQRSAAKVYAVDVGTNQLAWKLREDPRVVVIEQTNIRALDAALVPDPVSLTVIDVSFISLALVLPHVVRLSARPSELVALVKPQFEVGRADVGKGGIVRDPVARKRALDSTAAIAAENGYTQVSSMDSPILGAKGNHEFLLHARIR